ncbi:MAG: ABC transporter ATP-binding protein [Lachnospirales bacterium]
MELKVENLVAGYDEKIVVKNVSLKIPYGKISVIIGANASGKSTLLKAMTRIITPMSGEVTIDNNNIRKMNPKYLARLCGLLPQTPIVPEGVTIGDLVSRGRYPYKKLFTPQSKEDIEAITEAMEIMGIVELANSSISELSGGQRQRAWIATALAQQTDILFLDEPTTYLDINYQVEILDLMVDLNKKRNTTIVMVLHDINLSARYADYLFAMKSGELIKEGTPKEIVTEDLITEVFGMSSKVVDDPLSCTPLIIPKGRHFC